MPRGDGTGPMGAGPMTGRAAGYCAGFAAPGYVNPMAGGGYGRGFGRGFGRGRGWGRGFAPAAFGGYAAAPAVPGMGYAPYGLPSGGAYAAGQPSREQELEILKAQAENTGMILEDIQKRIAELEASEK